MNFILKIVEGPNKGAEIALVEGVAVTLGKGDDCDVILADATLPETPLSIEASADGVLVGGEKLAPFHVRTVGSTSFAFGPSDAPWRELVWPKDEVEEPKEETPAEEAAPAEAKSEGVADGGESAEKPAEESSKEKRRGGFLGCLVVLLALLLALAGLGWYFRAQVVEYYERWASGESGGKPDAEAVELSRMVVLKSVAEQYGLEVTEDDGIVKVSGNLSTRAKRLRATAEAYAAKPGVLVDISDDESFRMSADDALFTMTEGALKAVSATNRVLTISGSVQSAEALRKVVSALAADMPKLRDVDVSGVRISASAAPIEIGTAGTGVPEAVHGSPASVRPAAAKKSAGVPDLPVCGILTTPYPCLVMRNGSRVMEGAQIGGGVILKIEADAVTITNSTGRFTWRP